MDEKNPDWDFVVIFGRINQYYLTGTMQDGMLCIHRDRDPMLWVRKSYERALDESEFSWISRMDSFRDAAKEYRTMPESVYVETELLPIALYERFAKHFPVRRLLAVDTDIAMVRAVKSPYELSFIEESGRIHERMLESYVPEILVEGMSEMELATSLYKTMVDEGHHGIARFGKFNTEILVGQLGFGINSLYPTSFDGPGGSLGQYPSVPLLGDRNRRLKRGDLVFVDVGCGVSGYHTDKTMTYMFGASLPEQVIEEHQRCVEIQHHTASLLLPGNTPSEIYRTIMDSLDQEFQKNFMGFGERQVKFLGHGVGLLIDEIPVIAQGFDEPLEENMVFALEPKKGIRDVGMVGIENTFIVTPRGGRCITGRNPGLIPVY
ncbi:MAG: Xaa-Pro peptidase family protein [Methanospirillum sp.]|nr:Xaa-Pro peptidase family protein [Methanospirillum sp.]